MGRDAFKPKHASSVSISEVIDTGVNSNPVSAINSLTINNTIYMPFCQGDSNKSQHTSIKKSTKSNCFICKSNKNATPFFIHKKKGRFSPKYTNTLHVISTNEKLPFILTVNFYQFTFLLQSLLLRTHHLLMRGTMNVSLHFRPRSHTDPCVLFQDVHPVSLPYCRT